VAEVAAVGHDPDLQEIALDHEAGIAASGEGGDLVMAAELLADAVAKRVRALPEELVEHGDVVVVERLFVAVEGGGDLGHDLGMLISILTPRSTSLPRHTGEGQGGGKPPRRSLKFDGHDLCP